MSSKTRDLKDFRAQFDRNEQIRKRVKEVLVSLRKLGREEWRSEREIANMARVSCKDIPEIRKEFQAHLVVVPGVNRAIGREKRIWFADPKVAAKVSNLR